MATSRAIRADYVLPLKTASSDLSQSTYADMVDVDTTPPTSSSGLSNQDSMPHVGELHALPKPLGPASADIYTQRIRQPPLTSAGGNNGLVPRYPSNGPSKGGLENVVAQGQKRTASGEVKQNKDMGSGGLGTGGIRGHSRTTSTTSNSNRIAELSSQIRARLSYAASIVEKNRQSRDANGKGGVTPRHSQSPARSRTSSHDLGNIYFSPRNEAARSQLGHINGSPEKVPGYASGLTSPRKYGPLNGPPRISPSISADIASLTRSSSQPENTSTFPGEIPNLNKNQRRTLAPPADIVTAEHRARRRPNPNANIQSSRPNISPSRQPQTAQRGIYQNLTHNRSNSANSIVPGTPPPTYNSQPSSNLHYSTPAAISAKRRTPSQNAIMEQDAIETLLFMSSPGNSGYHPSTSSQNSQPQPRQQFQNREHNSLNQALSSTSMPAPRSTYESEVGLGIANGPGLDPHKTPTQTHSQIQVPNQRPIPRVSFLDNDNNNNYTGMTHHDLDFPHTQHRSFRFEDQAGDDIDRLLDQMVEEEDDSESDDIFIRNSQAWIQGGREGFLGHRY